MCYCQDFSSSCKGQSRFQLKGPISHNDEASSLSERRDQPVSLNARLDSSLSMESHVSVCVHMCVAVHFESFLLLHVYSHGGSRRVPEQWREIPEQAGTKISHDPLAGSPRLVRIVCITGEENNTVFISFETPRVGTPPGASSFPLRLRCA